MDHIAPNFHETELEFGRVRDVDGTAVTIEATHLSRKLDNTEYAVELGAFVLIAAQKSDLIASVSAIRLVEGPDQNKSLVEKRIVTCTLVGFLKNGSVFERGIERYPTVGCSTYLLTETALSFMFSTTKDGVAIGERCQRGGGSEHVRVDRMFGRHTAILGTSGSGKSWTVASLIQSAMASLPHTRILFLDLHDEYRAAFPTKFERLDRKIQHISVQNLQLPYWLLSIDELEELFVSQEHAAPNQSALLRDLIRELKSNHAHNYGLSAEKVTVDTPIYFSFSEFISRIKAKDTEMVAGSTSAGKQGPFFGKLSNLLMRLEARSSDPRFAFLFQTKQPGMLDEFAATLEEFFGIQNDTQLTILDLSGLASDVLSTVVGVITRLCFEYKYWDANPEHLPLTLVLEEAHNYLPRNDSARHRICIERVERVAKEGRKYGVGLLVISQRPSELSETVLSQCANFVVLRLTNPNDQSYVRNLLPDFLSVAVEMLPYLRTGEAVISGEAVEMPTRVRIRPPNPVPRSEDIGYLAAWRAGLPAGYSVNTVLSRWRQRQR
ncbi:MAG: ATP-binding protein [Myxococcales bacterium]|nr:ATP-binding protein [Myxococcales bacterium]